MPQVFDESSIILLQGPDGNRSNITPPSGELLYTTDTKKVYIGDGITPGGNLIGTYFNITEEEINELVLNHNHQHDNLLNINTNQHVDHSLINIVVGQGMEGGGNISSDINISMGTPGTISGVTTNTFAGTSHTHSLAVTDLRNVTNTHQILLAKALKDHIDNENHSGGSDGSDHNHDHADLTNINANQHIDHSSLNLTAGVGLSGGGSLDLSRSIQLGTPSLLSGTTTNTVSGTTHTHAISVTDSITVTDSTQILLAKALKDHIDNESHITLSPDQIHSHTIDNDLSNGYGKRYVSSSTPDDLTGNNGDIWLQYEE